MENIHEVSPPGFSGTVAAMKQHHPELSKGKTKSGKKKSPYALAWFMKNKGDKPHYKKQPDDDSRSKAEPKKKKEYKNEAVNLTSFKAFLEQGMRQEV